MPSQRPQPVGSPPSAATSHDYADDGNRQLRTPLPARVALTKRTLVSPELLAATLLGQQHEPPAGAHFALLAGVAVAALAIFGVRWWRRRRDTSEADEQPSSRDRPSESKRATEDK
jgi:hypothetical protein